MSLNKKAEEALQDEVLESGTPGNKFTGTIVDGILEVWATDNETVDVELPIMRDGSLVMEKIYFRVMRSEAERNRVMRAATEWIRDMAEDFTEKRMHPKWVEVFEPEPKVLAEVFLLAHLAVEPEWKDELPWLILAKKAGPVFRLIYERVTTAAVSDDAEDKLKEVLREKKDSNPTSGTT